MPRNTGLNDPSRNRLLVAQVSLNKPTYKCSRCQRKKPLAQFSNKQQNDLRKKIQTNKGNDEPSQSIGWMSCRTCMPGQNTEMKCIMCRETKGLDDFARTHRRNRDNAKCKECMDKILKTEPEQPLREESDEDSSDSNPYEDDMDETTASVNGLTLDGSAQQTTASSADGGGVWIQQQRYGAPASSGRPTFDPSAYGGTGSRGAGASGSAYGSARSSSKQTTVKTSKSGWAKPPRDEGPKKKVVEDELPPSSSSSDDEDDGWNKKGGDEDSDTSI